MIRRWRNSLDTTWERQVMWWGYTMCGWPLWYSRFVIRKAQLKTFIGFRKPSER